MDRLELRYRRRFNSDKIQTVQLITKTLDKYEQYVLLIQYNDCLVQTSLNKNIFKIICEPEAMIRRHLVRGYNEKIFYAESQGNVDKIYELSFNNFIANQIDRKEINSLAGSRLVAFEPNTENQQDDADDTIVVT